MASRKIDVYIVGAANAEDVRNERNIYIIYEKNKGRACNTALDKLKEAGVTELPESRKAVFAGETEGKLATIIPIKVGGVFETGKSVAVVERLVAEGLIEDNQKGDVLKEIADSMGI